MERAGAEWESFSSSLGLNFTDSAPTIFAGKRNRRCVSGNARWRSTSEAVAWEVSCARRSTPACVDGGTSAGCWFSPTPSLGRRVEENRSQRTDRGRARSASRRRPSRRGLRHPPRSRSPRPGRPGLPRRLSLRIHDYPLRLARSGADGDPRRRIPHPSVRVGCAACGPRSPPL